MASVRTKLVFLLLFLAISCEKIPLIGASDLSWEMELTKLEEDGLRSEQRFRPSSMSEETYQGAINAVKKAYQLTDISFTPRLPIAYNIGTYQANTSYTGMIYSSVKEIGTYVGSNISFHTFMTAIHNPKSRIYTDRLDESPYHGSNCRAYYGTVCSSMVSYALGLVPIHASYDFVESDEMEELDYSDLDNCHIADVLWRSGHVAMITNVVRDQKDSVVSIEIAEAIRSGCRRYSVSRDEFHSLHSRNFQKILRYIYLDRNINYTSVPEFVPVFGEKGIPFAYNDNICVDKGNRSCYFVGEDVVLNVFTSGDAVEIYKDGVFHSVINMVTEEIRLTDLEYGLYQARVVNGGKYSDYTTWLTVDYKVIPSVSEMKLYFSSNNSIPLVISFCGKSGGRSYSVSETICRKFTEEEIANGYLVVTPEDIKKNQPFFMITFATEYGNISTTPIEWK